MDLSYIALNFLPILAATGAGFAFGAVYYILLRKPYSAATAAPGDDHRRSFITYALVFALEFWLASILIGALILAPVEAGLWTVGLGSAFIIWVGFVFPSIVVNTRLALRPWRLAFIDGFHWLGVMLVMASVMILIGTTAPAA